MPESEMPKGGGQAKISELITCPKCGRSNPPGERYCDVCGASLVGIASTSALRPEAGPKRSFFGRLFGRAGGSSRDKAA